MMKPCTFALAAVLVAAGCQQDNGAGGGSAAAPSSSAKPNPATPATNASAAATPATGATAAASDVTTTASGLKYQVLKHGTGAISPKATDTVKVHYHGTLLDGTVFDSSVERGEPISFPLNRVIQGWTEGLQLMKVGDKFKFTIPSNLAYGPSSPSAKIPANSTLVFEVELLGIE
jgi:FKBP-type peptidyl-prolyl cis-trans isomerase